MDKELKHYTILVVISLLVFIVDYYLAFSQVSGVSPRSIFNAVLFATVLYLWSLYGVLKQTRFGRLFLKFTIFTYSVGLLSTLIPQGELTTNLLVISLTLVGLALNGYIFVRAKKLVKGSSL